MFKKLVKVINVDKVSVERRLETVEDRLKEAKEQVFYPNVVSEGNPMVDTDLLEVVKTLNNVRQKKRNEEKLTFEEQVQALASREVLKSKSLLTCVDGARRVNIRETYYENNNAYSVMRYSLEKEICEILLNNEPIPMTRVLELIEDNSYEEMRTLLGHDQLEIPSLIGEVEDIIRGLCR